MKKALLFLLVAFLVAGLFVSCKQTPEEKPAAVSEEQRLVISDTIMGFVTNVSEEGDAGTLQTDVSGEIVLNANAELGSYKVSGLSASASAKVGLDEEYEPVYSVKVKASANATGPDIEDNTSLKTTAVSADVTIATAGPSGTFTIGSEEFDVEEIAADEDFDPEVLLTALGIDVEAMQSEAVEKYGEDVEFGDYLLAALSADASLELKNVSANIGAKVGGKDVGLSASINGKISASSNVVDDVRGASVDVNLDVTIGVKYGSDSISFTANIKVLKNSDNVIEWIGKLSEGTFLSDDPENLKPMQIINELFNYVGLTLTPKAASVNGTAVDASSFYSAVMGVANTIIGAM